ncbi:MAG: TetR family transcriptional regulator [Nocardioides sp.]|uniref:TetR family transcriptional regulator n=1 Tax=Nocardioides sp. TaxID=35761 RepID=UPI0039E5329A
MARWQSGSRERLAEAALRLFATQGFERTTVAEIATEAGLTERTFFRYFADKREVLFAGSERFEAGFLDGVAASGATTPMALVTASLRQAAEFFTEDRRAWSRSRAVVVAANPALQERELHKMGGVVETLTAALVERGVDAVTAGLAAETGVSVFRRAFAAWIAEGESRPFAELQDELLTRLQALLGSP